jgi:hypothetical protein
VSGRSDAVDALAADLAARGTQSTRLRLDSAAHSRLIDPALGPMRAALRGLLAGTPAVPVISSLTGKMVESEFADPGHWAHGNCASRCGSPPRSPRPWKILAVRSWSRSDPGPHWQVWLAGTPWDTWPRR